MFCKRNIFFFCYRQYVTSLYTIATSLIIKCRSYLDKLWKIMNAIFISVIQVTIWMRGTYVSPGQVTMIAYPHVIRCKRFFMWQCVALLKFIKLSRMKSAIGTLVDKIIFILYAKFLSSSANHATQSLSQQNLYIHDKSSYEQRT